MPLINTADKLYIGSQAAAAAYMAGVKVWPPAVANTLSASLALIAPGSAPNTTSAWVRVTTAVSGIAPATYKFYSSTNGAGWVLRYSGPASSSDFNTTFSSTVVVKAETFDAAGNGLASVITNTVTTQAAPIIYVQRSWQGVAVAAASYNGSNQKRTDADGVASCYYGYFGTNQGLQKSLVTFAIPEEIRNCVSVDRVQLNWYNKHHFLNSGGRVSIVGQHGYGLPATFPGSTGPLLYNGVQANWAAPKPGQINGTPWFDVGDLVSSGRPSIKEEIRVNRMWGFGLVQAVSGTSGYGYAATNPSLDIVYTVAI